MLTLLKNVDVYSPESIGHRHILIGGDRILMIREEAISISDAAVIDCGGLTLVPGFIDGHAHLTGGGGESGFSTRVPAPFLGDFTAAGVTSVVGVLGTDDTARDTRSLVAQAYALREEGIGAWCHTGGYHIPPTTLTGRVRDDIVFVDPIIGAGEIAVSDHRSSQPTLQEILRLASDVHVAGIMTGKAGILHLHLGDGQRGLDLVRQSLATSEIPARVFNPTHVNRRKALFDEAVDLAIRGCTIDVTAFPISEGEDAFWAHEAVIRYLESAAPPENVTISSDGGGCLPVFDEHGQMIRMDIGKSSALLDAIRKLVGAGVPLEEALPSVTRNVARILRLHDRGGIAEGNRADLVLLDDSLSVNSVMAGGRWHIKDGQQVVAGTFEHGHKSGKSGLNNE